MVPKRNLRGGAIPPGIANLIQNRSGRNPVERFLRFTTPPLRSHPPQMSQYPRERWGGGFNRDSSMTDDNVIYGVDFKALKHYPPLANELAAVCQESDCAARAAYALHVARLADTAPSEWIADSGDCA